MMKTISDRGAETISTTREAAGAGEGVRKGNPPKESGSAAGVLVQRAKNPRIVIVMMESYRQYVDSISIIV